MASNTSEHNDSTLASLEPSSVTTIADSSRLENVFAMTGGTGTDSYAQNSRVQNKAAMDFVIPFYEKVLENVKLLAPTTREPPLVRVADLGCSSGLNAIAQMSCIIQKLTGCYMCDNDLRSPPEFQAFFCDLPSNDFNTLFQLLAENKKHNFFMSGTPGSFYGRLFPRSSINVFYSTFCLHWLSKIPDAVLDKNSPAFNRRGWALYKDSTPNTRQALREQAASDLRTFLHARAIELRPGGVLMFCASGRSVDDTEEHEDFVHTVQVRLGRLWRELTSEGIIPQEAADGFFLPFYKRSMEEIVEGIQEFSSVFSLHDAEMVKRDALQNNRRPSSSAGLTRFYRAVLGGLIKNAVGDKLSEMFWDRAMQVIEAEIMPNLDNYKLEGQKLYLIALTRREDGGELH